MLLIIISKAESSLPATALEHLTGPVKALRKTVFIEENTCKSP